MLFLQFALILNHNIHVDHFKFTAVLLANGYCAAISQSVCYEEGDIKMDVLYYPKTSFGKHLL